MSPPHTVQCLKKRITQGCLFGCEELREIKSQGNLYCNKDESVSKPDSEEQAFADRDEQQYREDVGGYHDDRNFHRDEVTKSLSKGRSFQNKTKTSSPKNRVL